MPDFLKRTAPYRQSGDLAVLFITSEPNEGVDHCKQTIADFGIDFPVLFFGDGENVPKTEWNVRGNPIGFLVNPQGVIVAHAVGARQLPGMIDLFEHLSALETDYPPVGLRVELVSTDEQGAELILDLNDAARRSVRIEIDLEFLDVEWDEEAGEFLRFERYKPDEENPEIVLEEKFGESSQLSLPVNIPAEIYEHVSLRIRMRLPGTEDLLDGEGLWTYQKAELIFDDPDSFEEQTH